MDISADLMELGRTPVAVVCAGVKSILDIEKTLEVLVILLFLMNHHYERMSLIQLSNSRKLKVCL